MMKKLVLIGFILLSVGLLSSCESNRFDSNDSNIKFDIQAVPAIPDGSFVRPIGMVYAGEGSDSKLYIIEQSGRILSIDPSNSGSPAEVFLDIRDHVDDGSSEKGLLGVAFHPDYQSNGIFFVNYTTEEHTVISKFTLGDSNKADVNSEKVILRFQQPYANHNGGQIAFGPDGYLYIATGDGGASGDPHGNGQNLNSLLGKILRIDVNHGNGQKSYSIPTDNPFINQENARPEIYAYGLRNPWRFSFDPATDKLWAADVGQNQIEEINWIEKGGNYGWKIKEGNSCYHPKQGCDSQGLSDPIWEYDHTQGQSVTGGYVYRGSHLPELAGYYIYGDFVSGKIWSLKVDAKGEADNKLLLDSDIMISSFGLDGDGELYIISYQGGIYTLEN